MELGQSIRDRNIVSRTCMCMDEERLEYKGKPSPYKLALGTGLPQVGFAHEELIDAASGVAAFGDGPDHQQLPTAHIAGREHSGDR